MIKYPCPICNKRACDSNKILSLAKLSKNNEDTADIIIKCQNCKNVLAVKVNKNSFMISQMNHKKEDIS